MIYNLYAKLKNKNNSFPVKNYFGKKNIFEMNGHIFIDSSILYN